MIGSASLLPSTSGIYLKKGPRGFRWRSKSGEETPWGGQQQPTSRRVSFYANRKAPRIDGAQLLLTFYIFARCVISALPDRVRFRDRVVEGGCRDRKQWRPSTCRRSAWCKHEEL